MLLWAFRGNIYLFLKWTDHKMAGIICLIVFKTTPIISQIQQLEYPSFYYLLNHFQHFSQHSSLTSSLQIYTKTIQDLPISIHIYSSLPIHSNMSYKQQTGCSFAVITHYIKFRMGQCSLSDQQNNGCADIFNNQDSEDGSITKQPCSEKDRILWDHQLNISASNHFPDRNFWQEKIQLTHPCFPQIAKDVTRTFPQLPYFGNKNNIQRFQKVLKKLALYFPQVGYTQGLNFAVGFLLISGCEDEQCFKLMSKMMVHDRILAIGLYQDNFPLVQLYCQVFWQLLEKKMPKVYSILKKSYITDDLWLFQWFISLFLYNFPLEFVKRLWDFIICKKEMGVVLIALGVIKSMKKQLVEIQFQDEMQFLDFVNQFKRIQFCREFLDLKKIISFANSITKSQIDRAIAQTKCVDNPYRIYFSSSASQQKEQWNNLIKKHQNERNNFAKNTQAIKYERTDVFDNLQKLILTKYKLYQSSELKGSNFYKRSNISTPMSFMSSKSKYGMGLQMDFNNKNKHL